MFSSENSDNKCAMAERIIRTLKDKNWRLFRYRASTKYLDKLQDIAHIYIHSDHASLKMLPVEVMQTNVLSVFNQLYKDCL